MPHIRAIVLAAGLSRRMNGPNKLLLPHGDATVIESVILALSACPVEIVVVTGRDADLIAAFVAPVATEFNPDFARGMGMYLAAGIRSGPAEGYLVVLGDMPNLSPSVVQAILAHHHQDRIVVPVYAEVPDRYGHPVLFGSRFTEELGALDADEGARAIIQSHHDRVLKVGVPGRLDDRDE